VNRKPGPSWRSPRFWGKLCAGIAGVVLTIVAGGVFGLRWKASAQRDAVAAIKEAHGSVLYDWEEDGAIRSSARFTIPGFPDWMIAWCRFGSQSEEGGPDAPAWLVSLLGVDCFGNVSSVRLPGRAPKDPLEQIGRLKRLKSLRLSGLVLNDRQGLAFLANLDQLEDLTLVRSRLRPGALSHLARLKKLQSLNLMGTNADNAALASIEGLTELTDLNLSGTAIDGAGLASLSRLSKLEDLKLDHTAIDDQGLSVLAKLPALAHLSLYGTKLTGAGLVHLKGAQRLEELRLEGTKLGDVGLVNLASVTSLKVLELKGTAVGDAGMKFLKGLTNLEELTLDRTAITDAGMACLTALPHLVIVSVQHTRVTEAGIAAVQRGRAALQSQQLAATPTSGASATSPQAGITDLEIVH
jgi:hypothetical protein